MNVVGERCGAFAAALLAGLRWPSGASAQSGNPIKVGDGPRAHRRRRAGRQDAAGRDRDLARRRQRQGRAAGPPGRDHRLRRPEHIRRTCRASTPSSSRVDKVDLLLGPYGTNFVAPAMPTIIQNNKMTISYTAIGINRAVQLSTILLDGAGRPGRRERLLQGLLRDGGGAEAEAADGRDPRRRRRVRPGRGRRRPRGAEEARLQARSTTRAIRRPPPTSRRWCARCRRPIADIVYVGAYPPDNVGIVRAANEIGLNPKMFGGAMIGMLITPIKVQLGPVTNGLVIAESFVPSPKLQFPGPRRPDEALSGQGGGAEDRSARLRLRAVRLRRRPDPRAGGRPRPRASTTTCSPTTCTATASRPWSATCVRQGRRMVEAAAVADPVPERRAEQPRSVPDGAKQPILWPPEYKTGDMIYPYADARKK